MLLAQEQELRGTAPDASLWLVFADDGEAELAAEAWPGQMYSSATMTSIAAAASASGAEPLKPFGAWAQKGKMEAAAKKAAAAPKPALELVVQPGPQRVKERRLALHSRRPQPEPRPQPQPRAHTAIRVLNQFFRTD